MPDRDTLRRRENMYLEYMFESSGVFGEDGRVKIPAKTRQRRTFPPPHLAPLPRHHEAQPV
jgi:hypothetical protein